jgi:F-type H+-transporting ATPase subunit epsilon
MHVTVISPERGVFDGAADAVVAPAFDGQVGILPGHAPFMTLLGKGVLTVQVGGAGGGSSRFEVSGGFLQVVGDAVRIVADQVQTS